MRGTYEIRLIDGSTARRTSSDPGRAPAHRVRGGPAPSDDWNKLDPRPLRGISHTAPYFHNNSAASLEEVVDHYMQFFKRVQALNPPNAPHRSPQRTACIIDRQPLPEEREALLAYLRKL